MARYPGATFVNEVANRLLPMAAYNRVSLHVTAGRGPNAWREPSHFYVRYSGEVKQYFDTIHQGQADLDGNDATISIETEGVEGEEWTAAQVAAIIKLVAWIIITHNIARKLATDSKVGYSSHGLSWHRLGIDGNFPSSGILAGRLQRGGGMHYSLATGKTCPCDERIIQIHEDVWPGVQALLGGHPIQEEDDMTPAQEKKLDRALELLEKFDEKGVREAWLRARISGTNREREDGSRVDPSVSADLSELRTFARRAERKDAARDAAIATLATAAGIDPDIVTATIERAVDKAMSDLTITLTTTEA